MLFSSQIDNSDFASITATLLTVYVALYIIFIPYIHTLCDLLKSIRKELDRINADNQKQQEEIMQINKEIKESGITPQLSGKIDDSLAKSIQSYKKDAEFFDNLEVYNSIRYVKRLACVTIILFVVSILFFAFRLTYIPLIQYQNICVYLFGCLMIYFVVIMLLNIRYITTIIAGISSLKDNQ